MDPKFVGPTNSTLQTASLLGLDTAPKWQFLFVFPRARRSPVSRSHATHFSPWYASRVRRLPQSSATPRRRRLARPPWLPGGGDSPGPRDSSAARTHPAFATPQWRGLAWPPRLPGGVDSPGPTISHRRGLPSDCDSCPSPRPLVVDATRADLNTSAICSTAPSSVIYLCGAGMPRCL